MENKRPLESIPDDVLLRGLADLLQQSRRCESVAHIAEVDERTLYAREASPSMFAYCTEGLHLSEAEAYLRIAVARASREHPMLLTLLGDGRLHLTGIAKLAPHLTVENRDDLLKRATHKSKRQIEELVAELVPRPDAPAVMRKLPERYPLGPDRVALEVGPDREGTSIQELRPDAVARPAPTRALALPAVVQPLAPARYKVQFTAGAELHDKLGRLRALMRSQVPDGDLAALIDVAVTEKLERLEARRFAKAATPRKGLPETDLSSSRRYIPVAVRRAVSERDGNHHRYPYALGGDRSPANVCLMCRTRNAYLAERDYGKEVMARNIAQGARAILTLVFQPDGFDLYDLSPLATAGTLDLGRARVIGHRSKDWARRFRQARPEPSGAAGTSRAPAARP